MEWWSIGAMGGHRIARGGENQLIGLIALLRLVCDTAAFRGKGGLKTGSGPENGATFPT